MRHHTAMTISLVRSMLNLVLAPCLAATPVPAADASDWNVQLIVYLGTPCRTARNAYVEIPTLQLIARSDRHGRVRLGSIPPGRHRLVVWTAHHAPVETTLTMSRHEQRIILTVDLETGLVSRLEDPDAHSPRTHDRELSHPLRESRNVIPDRRTE